MPRPQTPGSSAALAISHSTFFFLLETNPTYIGNGIAIPHGTEESREMSLQFKPDLLLDPTGDDIVKEVLTATNGRGADVVITACPAGSAQETALEIVRRHGRSVNGIAGSGGYAVAQAFIFQRPLTIENRSICDAERLLWPEVSRFRQFSA